VLPSKVREVEAVDLSGEFMMEDDCLQSVQLSAGAEIVDPYKISR